MKAAVLESRKDHSQIHGQGEFLGLLEGWVRDGDAGGSSVSVRAWGQSHCSAGNFPLLGSAMVPARMGTRGWLVSRAMLGGGTASPWISLDFSSILGGTESPESPGLTVPSCLGVSGRARRALPALCAAERSHRAAPAAGAVAAPALLLRVSLVAQDEGGM